MNLTIETALFGIGKTLRERVTPAVHEPFAAEMSRLASMLVDICANWVEDAAVVRVEENTRLRALFVEAGAIVPDGQLARRLADAALSADPGLRISELDRENGRLRTLLVELHAHIEGMNTSEARSLDQRIWRILEDVHASRAPRDAGVRVQGAGQ
jgi:hypothetical protein